MLIPPKNDPDYSQQRLNAIMGRRRLSFNPYSVSDKRLLEIASTTGWGNEMDITQIVTLTFTRLKPRNDYRRFDGIYFRMGIDRNAATEEVYIPNYDLTQGVTANDTVTRERTWIGSKPIRYDEDVERLVGKTMFVSRIIRGVNIFSKSRSAYRMHRLYGKPEKDAKTIREAMCNAKIEMLERILAYPQSPDYLSCVRGLIDYEPRIRLAIELIRRFPETPVPEE